MNMIKKINDSTYMVVPNHSQLAVITKENYSLGWVLRVYNADDVWYNNAEPKEGSKALFEAPRAKFEDQLSILINLIKYKKS